MGYAYSFCIMLPIDQQSAAKVTVLMKFMIRTMYKGIS